MAIDWSHDDSPGLRAAFDELTELLVREESLETVLQRVVALARSGIGACDLASVTYMHDGPPSTIVCTDSAAEEIDQAQYDHDAGPCLEAFRTRQLVSVPSMADDDRWPAFRGAALSHGVQSSLSLPLASGNADVGALNLYGRVDHAFNSVAPNDAVLFAKQAAAAIWATRTLGNVRDLVANLEVAIQTRDMIGMAKGVIMVNEKVTPDEAFKFLQAASQQRNIKLRDIAAQVVATGTTPT